MISEQEEDRRPQPPGFFQFILSVFCFYCFLSQTWHQFVRHSLVTASILIHCRQIVVITSWQLSRFDFPCRQTSPPQWCNQSSGWLLGVVSLPAGITSFRFMVPLPRWEHGESLWDVMSPSWPRLTQRRWGDRECVRHEELSLQESWTMSSSAGWIVISPVVAWHRDYWIGCCHLEWIMNISFPFCTTST